MIESYLRTPVIKLVLDGNLSLPEIGRIVPALSGYQLHPALVVKANGTTDRLLDGPGHEDGSRSRPRPARDRPASARLSPSPVRSMSSD